MMTYFKRWFGETSSSIRSGPTVAFINMSTVVTDDQVDTAVTAMQYQLDRDFTPIWWIDATLYFVPSGQQASEFAWLIYVLDSSDQPGASGDHDLTQTGNPIGRIFVKDDARFGLTWTVTLSHELLEMLVDPFVERVAFEQQTNTGGTLFGYEVADPVQDERIGYQVNGVHVSNFVYPSWFESFRIPGSCKFDHRGVVNAPYTLAPGGYVSIFEIAPETQGWTQKFAESVASPRALANGPQSRMKRRGKPLVR